MRGRVRQRGRPLRPDERPDERRHPPAVEGRADRLAARRAGLPPSGRGRRHRRHRVPAPRPARRRGSGDVWSTSTRRCSRSAATGRSTAGWLGEIRLGRRRRRGAAAARPVVRQPTRSRSASATSPISSGRWPKPSACSGPAAVSSASSSAALAVPGLGRLYDRLLVRRAAAARPAGRRRRRRAIGIWPRASAAFPIRPASPRLIEAAGFEQVKIPQPERRGRRDPFRLAALTAHAARSSAILRRLLGRPGLSARHNALFPLDADAAAARPLPGAGSTGSSNKAAPGRPGERLADALQELGPSFIKLGQTLATRADLMGAAICRRPRHPAGPAAVLPGCQAKATDRGRARAADRRAVRAVRRRAGRRRLDRPGAFRRDRPRAARSRSRCCGPGIEAAVERDLDFLLWLAEWAERTQPQLRRCARSKTVLTLRSLDAARDGPAPGGRRRRRVRRELRRGRGLPRAARRLARGPRGAW